MNELQQLLNDRFTADERKDIKEIAITNKEEEKEKIFFYFNGYIDKVDFSLFPNLETLVTLLKDNTEIKILQIILEKNTALTNLHFNSGLTSIDLTKNTALTTLNVDNNYYLETMAFLGMDKLTAFSFEKTPYLTDTPRTVLKNISKLVLEKNNQIQELQEDSENTKKQLEKEIEEYKNKVNQKEQQETAFSNQIQELQKRLTEIKYENNQNIQEEEYKQKIKLLQDLIISNRAEIKREYENKEKEWEKTIIILQKTVQDKEEEINKLKTKIQELQQEIEEYKSNENFGEDYEKLQKELEETKKQIKKLEILLSEKTPPNYDYQNIFNNINNNFQQTKQKKDEKNEAIINQIEDIISDDEEKEEFLKSLEKEESRSHDRNKKFFLDWLFEFSKIDKKFSYDAFIKIYPKLDIMKEEQFAEEVKKDLLISHISQSERVALIPYLLATKRTKNKLSYLIQDNNVSAVKFFMTNIGNSNIPHSFYGVDPIFTSQNWKIVRQTEKQRKIKEIRENISKALDLVKNDIIDENKLKETEKIIKVLIDEKEKDYKKFEALNEYFTNYPITNHLLEEYWEKWEELAGKRETDENKDKKEDSWEEMGNYFVELDKKGFLSYYCRKKKWDEKRLREVMNAFLESIEGTINKDNNYHQLPKLDLNKSFEELIPWNPEGVYFGHKTSAIVNNGGLSFNSSTTSSSTPFFKPFSNFNNDDEETPKKKSIYNWYSTNKITLQEFFKCQKLAQAKIIEDNLYNKTYTFEEIKEILKQNKDNEDINKYLKTLQEDCEQYLSWQSGSITNKWYIYWQEAKRQVKTFNQEQLNKGLKKILDKLTSITTEWDDNNKKTRNNSLQGELKKLMIKEKKVDIYSGWLTDDNIEFILRNNDFEINSSEEIIAEDDCFTIGDFTVRTDLANIYNSYYKAKTSQEWDLDDFINTVNKSKYTIFPLRVSINHWGMFIIEKDNLDYKVHYTSSKTTGITNEIREIQPLIAQLADQMATQNIQVLVGDKQKDGHNCGIYLLYYIKEILETQKLELKRTYTQQEIKVFRETWHNKIGEENWCKEDTNFYI